ncbi:MAG: Calx-beta domain-containing protein [Chloroflexota bacterium]
MVTTYIDFEISLQPYNGKSFPVQVNSPRGDARVPLRSLSEDTIYTALIAQLAKPEATQSAVIELGHFLFHFLFEGQIAKLYNESKAACAVDEGLRIVLKIAADASEMIAIPWELMAEPTGWPGFMVVRRVMGDTATAPLKVKRPLRLLLTASPTTPEEEISRDLQAIQSALSHMGDYVQMIVEPYLTRERLQRLLEQDVHIWHFVGQYDVEQDRLVLGDSPDTVESLNGADLGKLLSTSSTQLVVLNSFLSKQISHISFDPLARHCTSNGVAALVGMVGPKDATAALFAKVFYLAISEGLSLETSVVEGWRAIQSVPLDRPIVYAQSLDGRLFDVPIVPVPTYPLTIHTNVSGTTPFPVRVNVNDGVGTLLNASTTPEIVRREQVQPTDSTSYTFQGRAQEVTNIQAQLAPRCRLWLHGDPGSGISALLQHVAHQAMPDKLPDGIVYIDGEIEPVYFDDVVQRLFEQFYTSSDPVKVNSEQSYLAELRATVLLNRLQIHRSDVEQLATRVLHKSAVLIASDNRPFNTASDVPIASLSRQDAVDLCLTEGVLEQDTVTLALLDSLCAMLSDLPLPLVLAIRLVREQVLPLEQLVQELEELAKQEADPSKRYLKVADNLVQGRETQEPTGKITSNTALLYTTRLVLNNLDKNEQAVLASLVRMGGAGASEAAVEFVSNIPAQTAHRALRKLQALGLSGVEQNRIVVSVSLRRILEKLLRPGPERSRVAAFFAEQIEQRNGDFDWLEAERNNLMDGIETLLARGQAVEAGKLVRALHPLIILRGLWGSWGQLIDWAGQVAVETGDNALRAWALHERGTRAGLLGNRAAAQTSLTQALQVRRSLRDQEGMAASQHNLAFLDLLPQAPTQVSSQRITQPRTPVVAPPSEPTSKEVPQPAPVPPQSAPVAPPPPPPAVATEQTSRSPRVAVTALLVFLLIGVGSLAIWFLLAQSDPPVAIATAQPSSGTYPLTVTFDASESFDPDTEGALSYWWDFGDGTEVVRSDEASMTYIYATPGEYVAKVFVRNTSDVESEPTDVVVEVMNEAPVPVIEAPTDGTLFRVGETLTLRGSATDPEEEALDDTVLSWSVSLYDGEQSYEVLSSTSGNDVRFEAPALPNLAVAADCSMEIQLTVTDSQGATSTVSQILRPSLVDVAFATEPAGLDLLVDGMTVTTPQSVTSWEGHVFDVETESQQDSEGQWLGFSGWSDAELTPDGLISQASASYTATFTPVVVEFVASSFRVQEGDEVATITMTLSMPVSEPVTVSYTAQAGSTASEEDFDALSDSLTFAPGETTQTFDLPIIDDELSENNEIVSLTLSDADVVAIGTRSFATLTIIDNDELATTDNPILSFTTLDPLISEAAGEVTIAVSLNAPSNQTVTVDYATIDDTAIGGNDYVAVAGTLSFAPGETTQSFSFPIVDDGASEGEETIVLRLANPANAELSEDTAAVLTIIDDE